MGIGKLRKYLYKIKRETDESAFHTDRNLTRSDAVLAWKLKEALLRLPPGSRVLEIGAGEGKTLEEARSLFPNLDFFSTNLRNSSWKALEREVIASAAALPFEKNSFDFVYGTHFFQYVPDKAGAIREIHRVLKPGRTALLNAYKTRWFGTSNFRTVNGKEALKLFEHHGDFKVLEGRDGKVLEITKKAAKLRLKARLDQRRSKYDDLHFESVYKKLRTPKWTEK